MLKLQKILIYNWKNLHINNFSRKFNFSAKYCVTVMIYSQLIHLNVDGILCNSKYSGCMIPLFRHKLGMEIRHVFFHTFLARARYDLQIYSRAQCAFLSQQVVAMCVTKDGFLKMLTKTSRIKCFTPRYI